MNAIVMTAVGGTFLLSLVCTFVVRGWARRTGFVDQPGGHKGHQEPIALGGGVAIVIGACLPVLVGTLIAKSIDLTSIPWWIPKSLHVHLPGIASKWVDILAIVGGATALHIVGLVDDRRGLSVRLRLSIQFGVALFIAWPIGIRAAEALGQPVSILLTVLWIVIITNAFNFLDNMDGLSAGVAAIAAAVFALAAMNAGQVFVPIFAWIIVGTTLGFLVFNFSPATIFMGDAGSMPLGFLLAVLTVLTTYYDPQRGATRLGVLVPLVVLAVPLYDMASVIVHRYRAGQSPFRGDKRHFSHRLVKRGLTSRGAVLTIYLATAATALPAVAMPMVDWQTAVLLLFQCLGVVLMIAILEHVGPSQGEC